MKEIVAAMINQNIITNNPRDIRIAIEGASDVRFLDRLSMQFMAACDLGLKWEALAESKTLFCVDDEGKPRPPEEMQKISKEDE